MGELTNADLTINSGNGGAVTVTISTAATQAVATAVPCRECWITAAVLTLPQEGIIKMTIGSVVASATGITLPRGLAALNLTTVVSTMDFPQPIRIPVDDVSKLWFWVPAQVISNLPAVDIIYRK